MSSAIYLYYLMSRNEESAPFSGSGLDEIALLIQAKLPSYRVRWLNKQHTRLFSLEAHLATCSRGQRAAGEAVNFGSFLRVKIPVYQAPPGLKARNSRSVTGRIWRICSGDRRVSQKGYVALWNKREQLLPLNYMLRRAHITEGAD